jgi:hypothetical protein
MADMLIKSAPWSYGCDCGTCARGGRRKVRRIARRRERRAWQKDVD